jgi:pyruvate ferredoxin oxidoreductase gamma subunit
MKDIFEVVIHGRGGQGAKSAAQLIVETAIENGKYIQAFPEYGPERTGAPMKTFARISDRPIKTYEPVTEPDAVLVIDPSLVDHVTLVGSASSVLIVNTAKNPEEIKNKTGFPGKVYTVDATKISLELLGTNMPNMPILGALVKVTNVINIDVLTEKVKKIFLKKIGEEKTNKNIAAIKKAYDEVKG